MTLCEDDGAPAQTLRRLLGLPQEDPFALLDSLDPITDAEEAAIPPPPDPPPPHADGTLRAYDDIYRALWAGSAVTEAERRYFFAVLEFSNRTARSSDIAQCRAAGKKSGAARREKAKERWQDAVEAMAERVLAKHPSRSSQFVLDRVKNDYPSVTEGVADATVRKFIGKLRRQLLAANTRSTPERGG